MKNLTTLSILMALLAFDGPVAAQCETRRLVPSGAPGDEFGTWLAMDGGTVLVGAPGQGTTGAAYVYVHDDANTARDGEIVCDERLGGLLKCYRRAA